MNLRWIAGAAAIFGLALPTVAQSRNPSHTPAPRTVLYRHFLAHVQHLETEAQKRGQDGVTLREHYQKHLGFSPIQFAKVKTAAHSLNVALHTKDQQAKQVISRFRAQLATVTAAGSRELPPPPAELLQLQRERDQLIEQAVIHLSSELGVQDATRLNTFVQQEFGPNVHVQRVNAPRSYDPAKHPAPPFEKGND